MHNGEVMAVVTLLHSQPNYFDDHALRLVTIVANQTRTLRVRLIDASVC